MAQYFTDDFADFGTDWTVRYNTAAATWAVSSGDLATGDTGVSGDWCAATWNDIDGDSTRADVEVLALWNWPTNTTYYPLIVRASGADESATHYSVMVAGSVLRVYKCVGADTPTQIGTISRAHTTGVDYWIRLRVNGSSIQCRDWADGSGEPGTWQIDVTDTSVTGVGWVGAALYGAGTTTSGALRQLGVGTNGDSAPASAPSGGDATITMPGASATPAVGSLAATGGASGLLAGVAADAAVGAIAATGGTAVALVGVAADPLVGAISASAGATAALQGVAASPAVGQVAVQAGGSASVVLPGCAASPTVGALAATGAAQITLSGIAGLPRVGQVIATDGTTPTVEPIRFDIATGRLVKVISGSIAISF